MAHAGPSSPVKSPPIDTRPELPRAEVMSLSTRAVPPQEQWRYWQDQISDVVVPVILNNLVGRNREDGFDASFTLTRLGGLTLFQPRTDAAAFSRVSDDRMKDEYAGVSLAVLLSGANFAYGTQLENVARQGDVYAYDWSVRFDMKSATSVHHAFLILPRARLDGLAERMSRPGRVFAPDRGLPYLFRYHMARLAALKAGEAPSYAELPDDVQQLALALLDGRPERLESAAPALRRAQLAAVKDYIARRAPLGDLPTERIAARFGMSPAHLERLFALVGMSVQDHVRDCRLHACRQALADPRFLGLSPDRIAQAFGFDDPVRFQQAYRQRFGQVLQPDIWARF